MIIMRKLNLIYILFIIVLLISIPLVWIKTRPNEQLNQNPSREIKYVSIGDSYTIGLGIDERDRWPNVLTNHLRERGINIRLVANPSVSGYTVVDAIELEVPAIESLKPDLVTVLIGANDSFIRKSQDDFQSDLIELLDQLQQLIPNPKNIILVTIPDYSKSPSVQQNATTDGLSDFIASYNNIIKNEANKRDLKVADIFLVSQTMTGQADYTEDGLHPSGEGYAKWEKVILPVVSSKLGSP